MDYESSFAQPSQDFSLDLPHLDFMRLQSDVYDAITEIRKQQGFSIIQKLMGMIFGKKTVEHSETLNAAYFADVEGGKSTRELIAQLEENPARCQVRSNLVKNLLEKKKSYEITTYRQMLLQSCLSLYVGGTSPRNLQTAGQMYLHYLRQVAEMNKKKLLSVRSDQLKTIDVSRISMDDMNKDLEGLEPEDVSTLHELNLSLHLLERNKELISQMITSISIPLDLSELNRLDPKVSGERSFLGENGGGSGINEKETIIIRKATAIVDVMRYILPLHSLGISISRRLQAIEPAIPQHYLLEARIRTEAFSTLLLRMELKQPVKQHLYPTYKKMMEAYYKAFKRTSKSTPDAKEFAIFSEFAQAAYLAHLHRKNLGLESSHVAEMLKDAKQAVDLAMVIEPHPNQRKMQARINEQLQDYGVTPE
jgi:hypothetical protein